MALEVVESFGRAVEGLEGGIGKGEEKQKREASHRPGKVSSSLGEEGEQGAAGGAAEEAGMRRRGLGQNLRWAGAAVALLVPARCCSQGKLVEPAKRDLWWGEVGITTG